MKNLRLILPSLALAALTATGCWIVSAQIFTHFALTNPFTINNAAAVPFDREYVDLNTIKDYADNKDKLQTLSDVAIVGTFTNVNGPAGGVVVYITAGNTNLGTLNAVTGSTKLWGPGTIGPTGDVRKIGWDESAALFDPAGKAALINAVKGNGIFTIYCVGTGGTYNIRVDDGFVILVLDAAK